MLDEYCPDCGTHRVGLFRYCKTCGLDYDELDARGDLPGSPYASGPATVRIPPTSTPAPARAVPVATIETGSGGARVARSGRSRGRPPGPFLRTGFAAVLAVAVVGVLAVGTGARPRVSAAGPSSPPAEAAAVAALAPASAQPAPTAEPTVTPAEAASVFAPTGETTQATVTRVIDGDTITADIDGSEYRVRYIGIDTPALVDLDQPVGFMAQEAADANRRLVSSAKVILERDISQTDAHGQLLRNVWVDQDGTLVMVGLALVRDGLARVDTSGPDQKYAAALGEAEGAARAADIGLWSEPQLPLTGSTAAPVATGLPRLVGLEPLTVYRSTPTELSGGPGVYSWRSVRFVAGSLVVSWELRASAAQPCAFDWRLEPSAARAVSGTAQVRGGGQAKGTQTVGVGSDEAILVVTSTCPRWTLSLQGARP